MTKPLVTYPDAERVAVDLLTAELDDPADVTVGINLPAAWTPTDPVHVQVTWDGTPTDDHPVRMIATVRITVWADSPTEAKRVAMLAKGHLCGYTTGITGLVNVMPLTGPLPVRDPDHDNAALCMVTVRMVIASQAIT